MKLKGFEDWCILQQVVFLQGAPTVISNPVTSTSSMKFFGGAIMVWWGSNRCTLFSTIKQHSRTDQSQPRTLHIRSLGQMYSWRFWEKNFMTEKQGVCWLLYQIPNADLLSYFGYVCTGLRNRQFRCLISQIQLDPIDCEKCCYVQDAVTRMTEGYLGFLPM